MKINKQTNKQQQQQQQHLLFSASSLSLVTGIAWVITLKHFEPSFAIYVICNWNGRCSFPPIRREDIDFFLVTLPNKWNV